MLRRKPSPRSSPNRLRSPPRPPLPPAPAPRPGGPTLPVPSDVGGSGGCPAPTAAPGVLGAHAGGLGMGPWGGPTCPGCFWLLGGGLGVSHGHPTPLRDGGTLGDDAQAVGDDGQVTARGEQGFWGPRQPHGDTAAPSAASPAGGHKPGDPGARLPPPPAPTPPTPAGAGSTAVGTAARGAGRVGERGGTPVTVWISRGVRSRRIQAP